MALPSFNDTKVLRQNRYKTQVQSLMLALLGIDKRSLRHNHR